MGSFFLPPVPPQRGRVVPLQHVVGHPVGHPVVRVIGMRDGRPVVRVRAWRLPNEDRADRPGRALTGLEVRGG